MYTMKDEAKYNVRSLRKSLGFHAFQAFRCRCCYRFQPERYLKYTPFNVDEIYI